MPKRTAAKLFPAQRGRWVPTTGKTALALAAILAALMLPVFCLCQRGLAQGPAASEAPDLRKIAVRSPWNPPRWIKRGAVALRRSEPEEGKWVVVKRRGQPIHGILSPNGQWLLNPTGPKLDFKVLRLKDGFYRTRHPTTKTIFWTEASDPLWMPDNRHYVQLWSAEDKQQTLYVVIADRNSDRITQKAIGSPKGVRSWPDLMQSYLLGFIGPGRVLATCDNDYWHGTRCTKPFYSFQVGAGAGQLRDFSVSLPPGATEWGIPVLSPDGKRLAWLLFSWLLSSKDEDKVSDVLLACCRVDGTGMEIIGKMKINETRLERLTDAPRALDWLPDGRHVHFVYQNSVWTVPVQADGLK